MPLDVEVGEARPHLPRREPFPEAVADFAERRLGTDSKPVRGGNCLGGFPGATERARVHRGQGVRREDAGRRLRLDHPPLGKGNVQAALVPALTVPLGLGVPQEKQP